MNGHLLTAIRFNPMLIVGGPIMIALLLWKRHREKVTGLTTAPRLPWVLMTVVLVYFVARNVPSPSRSWLAPPDSTAGPTGAEPLLESDRSDHE